VKKLFFLFFLASCSLPNSTISSDKTKLNFDDNLNFEEFNKLLIQYGNSNSYPDIDE
jgi:hypothetical protein